MIFGKVDDPGLVDFTLPVDAPETKGVLSKGNPKAFEAFVGCAKWNRTDLKGFYPRGTKDELTYYATQFNSIELNATFYGMPKWEQVEAWRDKTPEGFRFFPKVSDLITHYRRLNNVEEPISTFANAVSNFGDKLGMAFLQLHDNFKPKDFAKLEAALRMFPAGFPLAVEVRNGEWFADKTTLDAFCGLLSELGMANIIVDTAGRRDMLHMRLTTPVAFVRYVGANHPSDVPRLDEWVERIADWKKQGLEKLYFFVHQNIEKESPLLSSYFIERLNAAIGTDLKIPARQVAQQSELF
ncbi:MULTISPECIES: DUF72 domain-containing protein [unclassified Flavobacterium]|uniref:DUF72 domain-containing protein n=1 Tax=unclassified Flavobacterium TaxID=196869 RepID=UPI001F13D40A|nr:MULTISPECIES: DUF72 domain-containing protein [unclassified Flavobacterium]UMY66818.1 DUF72 domain-containing protein [Flavobacterium sp. HJ-32-4]